MSSFLSSLFLAYFFFCVLMLWPYVFFVFLGCPGLGLQVGFGVQVGWGCLGVVDAVLADVQNMLDMGSRACM